MVKVQNVNLYKETSLVVRQETKLLLLENNSIGGTYSQDKNVTIGLAVLLILDTILVGFNGRVIAFSILHCHHLRIFFPFKKMLNCRSGFVSVRKSRGK